MHTCRTLTNNSYRNFQMKGEKFSSLICVWLSLDFSRLTWLGLDNITPVSQHLWLGMFLHLSRAYQLASQQVCQPTQQGGTTIMPDHVTQEKCTTGGYMWIILPQRNTGYIFSDLCNSVLTTVSNDTRFKCNKIWFWIIFCISSAN